MVYPGIRKLLYDVRLCRCAVLDDSRFFLCGIGTFYINRAGKNLSQSRKQVLERAKDELRDLFQNKETNVLTLGAVAFNTLVGFWAN